MPRSEVTVIEAIEHQAGSCESTGSPLYGALLRGLAADHRAGGITAELLDGVSGRPLHDALPLRYLATAHRLALAGEAPELAAHYPSCGGTWRPERAADLVAAFVATAAAHRDVMAAGVRRNVQTNEVGRAAVLMSGFSWVAARWRLPLRTLEIGASAGLLSRWPHYAYDTGRSAAGTATSSVRFGPEWFDRPPPLRSDVRAVQTLASDVAPIDVLDMDGELSMLSFVWPDHDDRRHRLLDAIAVARAHPVPVERADAGEWLAGQLDGGLTEGLATVVFHSIVWQYLAPEVRERVRGALAAAGATATDEAPLCWLRMEPAGPVADLRATTWPGGDEVRLAEVGYHGAGVRWLLP